MTCNSTLFSYPLNLISTMMYFSNVKIRFNFDKWPSLFHMKKSFKQLEKARKIVGAFNEAREKDPNVGVIVVEGNQIEELHVAHAQRILDAEDLVVKVSEDNTEQVSDISKGQSKFNVGNFFEDFYMDQLIKHSTPRTIKTCLLYTSPRPLDS